MIDFQSLNRDRTVIGLFFMDTNQSDKEIALGLEFLDNYSGKGSGTNAYRVLKQIFEFASSESAPKDDSGSVIFSWRDLQTEEDVSDDGKRLKKYLKDAIEKWPLHYERLNQDAVDRSLKYFPIIERGEMGGGAGNVTKYLIKPHPVTESTAVDKTTLPRGFISYTSETSETTNPFIRFVDGMIAKGFKLYMILGTVMLAIILAILTLMVGLYLIRVQTTTFGILSSAIDIAIIVGALYSLFSPMYFAVMNRIIIAPVYLSPSRNYSTQLEYIRTREKHKNGKPVRQFRIVSYVGECLICKSKVDVEKGRGSLSGRLIGRCADSPTEHIYTFDHQTKLGKLIHSEYLDLIDQKKITKPLS